MAYGTGDVLPLAEVNSKPRANLKQEDAISYPVPITAWVYADGDVLNTTGAAGDPQIVMGGYGSGTGVLRGQDAHGTTKTETVCFAFRVPECYVAAETITLSVTARYSDTGTGTMSAKSIDCECYEIAEAGTAGSDICATAAQTLTTSMAAFSFTITASGVSPGDLLRFFVRTVLTESGGTGAQKAEIGGATVKLDIKG
ncbi:MAG: hypothetical protein PHX83_12015 [Acidobacteriia bacterium]|nr:hypothetical protein [Terriglobia bacterium]